MSLPYSDFRQVWDLVALVFVLYSCAVVSFRASFGRRSVLPRPRCKLTDTQWESNSVAAFGFEASVDWIVDAFFMVDIFFRLRHFARKNDMAPDLPFIRRDVFSSLYLRRGFVLDLLAVRMHR